MLPRSLKIALPCVFPAMAALVLAVTVKPDPPVDIKILSAAQVGPTKAVVFEFRRCNPKARFSEDLHVQAQIGGQWQPPVSFPPLQYDYLLARTNCEHVEFTLPAGTKACRFTLGYRVGSRPYCRAYFLLQKHGLYQRFPKASRLVLKCVPQQPRLRHVDYVLRIPGEVHAKHAPAPLADVKSG